MFSHQKSRSIGSTRINRILLASVFVAVVVASLIAEPAFASPGSTSGSFISLAQQLSSREERVIEVKGFWSGLIGSLAKIGKVVRNQPAANKMTPKGICFNPKTGANYAC